MRVVFGVDLTYFYWSCAAGIVLAALYDILRIKRRLVHTPDFLVNIEDILYLIVFGISVIYTSYEKNNGNLRLYGIAATAAVFAVYRLVLGNAAVRFLSFIIQSAVALIKKIIHFLTAPFRIIYLKAVRPLFCAISKKAGKKRRASSDENAQSAERRENL